MMEKSDANNNPLPPKGNEYLLAITVFAYGIAEIYQVKFLLFFYYIPQWKLLENCWPPVYGLAPSGSHFYPYKYFPVPFFPSPGYLDAVDKLNPLFITGFVC